MTYLCVHQPRGEITRRTDRMLSELGQIGLIFLLTATGGSWLFVGWLVDHYEHHLARSEAQKRTLVESSDPIVVSSPNGRILDLNPEARQLWDLRGASPPLTLAELWAPQQREKLGELVSETTAGVAIDTDDLTIQTGSGRKVPVSVRIRQIDYDAQPAIYVLLRDITETRRAQEEMQEANRALRELDRMKTDFLNTVSHELRTPLTSIKWSADSLTSLIGKDQNDKVSRLLEIIRNDNQRLTSLIEQLLVFSRIEAGQLAPKFASVNLHALIEASVTDILPLAQQKSIAISVAAPESDPAMDADPEQVRQALDNLLGNAEKYTPEGGSVQVSVRAGDPVEITVTDTGIGIAENALKHVFEKFFRAEQPEV